MRQCKQAKYGERYGAAAGSFTACRCDCGHVSHACLHAHALSTNILIMKQAYVACVVVVWSQN